MAQRLDVQYIQYYTDGNAARKAEIIEPFKTLRLPKLKKKKVKVLRIDPVAVLGIAMSMVMLVLLTVGAVQLSVARQEAAAMESYVHQLQQENERLQTEFHEKLDLEDVRRTADALGLVPVEQVKHIALQVPETEDIETPNGWERLFTFLTGLFA